MVDVLMLSDGLMMVFMMLVDMCVDDGVCVMVVSNG